jgi:hypothetical protein
MNQIRQQHCEPSSGQPILGRLQWQSIVALTMVAVCHVHGFSVAALGQADPAADELARFRWVDEEMICVRVKLFNEEALFVLDTGASYTCLDIQFQNRLGKRLKRELAQTAIREEFISFYRSPVMMIITDKSEMELIVPNVGVVDLKSIRSFTDQPIAGLIGIDFLKNHILRLNFDERYAALVRAPRWQK